VTKLDSVKEHCPETSSAIAAPLKLLCSSRGACRSSNSWRECIN